MFIGCEIIGLNCKKSYIVDGYMIFLSVNMDNKDAFFLTKMAGEKRVDATARQAAARVRQGHSLMVVVLAAGTLALAGWMFLRGVPMQWIYFLIGGVTFAYKLCKMHIDHRGGRPLTIWEKVLASVYITGLVAGAFYLYRQMAEIQRIFEMT